jgi:hypothetical protein
MVKEQRSIKAESRRRKSQHTKNRSPKFYNNQNQFQNWMREEKQKSMGFATIAGCTVCHFQCVVARKRLKATTIRNTNLTHVAMGKIVFNTPIQKNIKQHATVINTLLFAQSTPMATNVDLIHREHNVRPSVAGGCQVLNSSNSNPYDHPNSIFSFAPTSLTLS